MDNVILNVEESMSVIINAKTLNATQIVLHVFRNARFNAHTHIVHKNVESLVSHVMSLANINANILNAKRNVLRFVIENLVNFHAEKSLVVDTNV